MREFIGEYGKVILAVLVATAVLGMGNLFLVQRLDVHYPDLQAPDLTVTTTEAGNYPVLIISNNLKIKLGDGRFDAKSYTADKACIEYRSAYKNYQSLVKAYEDSRMSENATTLKVYGLDGVDIQNAGKYPLLYQAVSIKGRVFTKKTTVIVN